MKTARVASLLLWISSAAFGCGEKYPEPCASDEDVRWDDVQPIFAAHCTRCHAAQLVGAKRSDAPARVNYDTFEAARRITGSAIASVRDLSMPSDAPGSVSDDELCRLEQWREAGLKR